MNFVRKILSGEEESLHEMQGDYDPSVQEEPNYPGFDKNRKALKDNLEDRAESSPSFIGRTREYTKENPFEAWAIGSATGIAVLTADYLLREPDLFDQIYTIATSLG